MIERPDPDAYPPYFRTYVRLVPEGDIVQILRSQIEETCAFLNSVGESRSQLRYDPDKWSIREIVGHLADTERVFAYRALWFARGDQTPLPGFEQDDWVAHSSAHQRSLGDLTAEYRSVRDARASLFEGLDDGALARSGLANENRLPVAVVPFVIAGHERHHRRIIQEKYL